MEGVKEVFQVIEDKPRISTICLTGDLEGANSEKKFPGAEGGKSPLLLKHLLSE